MVARETHVPEQWVLDKSKQCRVDVADELCPIHGQLATIQVQKMRERTMHPSIFWPSLLNEKWPQKKMLLALDDLGPQKID